MQTLCDDLDAFYLEHRRCGELDGGADGDWVWMTCTCGAALTRRITGGTERVGAIAG